MMPGTRIAVHACSSPRTYKYFLPTDQIQSIWTMLRSEYGRPRQINGVNILHLETDTLLLRSPACGTPVTVVRKRSCSDSDIARLHQIFRFDEAIENA